MGSVFDPKQERARYEEAKERLLKDDDRKVRRPIQEVVDDMRTMLIYNAKLESFYL